MTQHIPKGTMCQGCAKLNQNCATLDFSVMQKIKTYADGVAAVKCSEFLKAARPALGKTKK